LNKAILHNTVFFFTVLIILSSQEMMAQKTDTIVHINGNILTGELKKMVYGIITWKTDGMGTLSIEEVKVKTIKSDKMFEIKMKNGFVYFGSLDTSHVLSSVYIVFSNGRQLAKLKDIVEIYPIKKNFWMRSSGNLSLGANYSKGSKVGTISFSGNLNYRKKRTLYSLTWDDNNTFQGDTLSSSKSDAAFGWQRLIKGKWYFQISVSASQNTELGTKVRIGLTPVALYDIVYNNWNRFYVGTGMMMARETPYDDSGITNDLAGFVGFAWKVYRYKKPKVWVEADFGFIPYFTDWGRNRLVFNLNPKVSVFNNDFKIGFKFYYNYDSKPSSVDYAKNDYGITLELTYSFH